jgi:hypothetical protein
VLSIVSAGLSLAEWHYWIDENPAESATMPSPGDHEPGGPTLEQAAALLASTTPPPQARQTARRHPPRLPQDRRWIRFGEFGQCGAESRLRGSLLRNPPGCSRKITRMCRSA